LLFDRYQEVLVVAPLALMNAAALVAYAVHRRETRAVALHGARTVRSVPPSTASVLTVAGNPPNPSDREVVAAAGALVLTTEERVAFIVDSMRRTERSIEELLAIPAPASIVEHVCASRREVFDWLAGDDPEICCEWFECVEGVGRWSR
jgi:hypothetical protein